MTRTDTSLRLTGARVLRDGQLSTNDVSVVGDVLTDHGKTEIDVGGYLIMPGIIDLHGDAFEHHVAPRPTAPFALKSGLVGTDKDAAANGITTAWMAQSWSWEGGHRAPEYAEAFLQAHQEYRPHMMTDLRIQIRCETHMMGTEEALLDMIERHDVKYVIFNNHLHQVKEIAKTQPDRVQVWAAKADRSVEQYLDVVNTVLSRTDEVSRFLCTLASAFDTLGVRYGSHDDPDGQTRERFSMIGAKICEFPTHISAAALANTWGDPVLMGAPNVVRGGSQAGGIAASLLVREGLCDALVSDYHYPTLSQAAFRLADDGIASLPDAWAMISSRPAQIMGLTDRGEIAAGKRADLTFVNEETLQVEGTMVAGRWSYLAGDLAHRIASPSTIKSLGMIAAQ